jgi:glycosyltransferase involved in cell wall biosynthesis
MRPVTVVVPLPPSYRGGTEEYAYRVVAQASRVVPVRLVTTAVRWGHDADPISIGSAEQIVLPGFEMFERPVVLSRSARSSLRSIVADSSLIHLHMPFPLVERWVTGWAERERVPVVLTYHMDAQLSSSMFGPLATSMYRSISARPALRGASAIVSNSRGYAEASPVLSQFLPKVRVIAKGVDPARLGVTRGPSSTSASFELPGGTIPDRDPKIVFVGRLVAYKGIPILLEAIRQLAQDGLPLHLYIAGRGPEEPGLRRRVAATGLTNRVTFLGFVSDARIESLYRWADIVACPSINSMESTPTSLEEAASLGIRVLGSNLPGASETIPSDGVRGMLVRPGDAAAVAAGLRQLLASAPWTPTRVRTWEDVSNDYLSLYGELVPELRQPRRPDQSEGVPPSAVM